MIIDANLLLYATDSSSVHHDKAAHWLETVLTGSRRVGLPLQTIAAFVRISTNPRVWDRPITPAQAWRRVRAWLDADPVWVPTAGARTAEVLGDLIMRYHLSANLVPDATLAALALEHGLVVVSADTDFARFSEIGWENPLADT